VLHRDVKPSNLLLDVWGTVWLTDFGLAKATGTPDLTRTGDLLGTLRYMAPERFEGHADVRSDVYALGLTLYELLALRPAFAGHDQAEVVRHITAEAPRLDRIDPRLPRDLVTIVHKAMARSPADRYQTARALADDLRRFLDDRSILARRASLAEQGWRWCRRNPTGAGLLAALLALLLVATGGGLPVPFDDGVCSTGGFITSHRIATPASNTPQLPTPASSKRLPSSLRRPSWESNTFVSLLLPCFSPAATRVSTPAAWSPCTTVTSASSGGRQSS
jgi:serine/threonine protein kinase